jgi:hypothetical protein
VLFPLVRDAAILSGLRQFFLHVEQMGISGFPLDIQRYLLIAGNSSSDIVD